MQATPCAVAPEYPPRPPLGVIRSTSQVTAPAAACWSPPLHSDDHPATPWWSSLFRGSKEAAAGARGVVGIKERRAGRVW
jgi:hypothetical protein